MPRLHIQTRKTRQGSIVRYFNQRENLLSSTQARKRTQATYYLCSICNSDRDIVDAFRVDVNAGQNVIINMPDCAYETQWNSQQTSLIENTRLISDSTTGKELCSGCCLCRLCVVIIVLCLILSVFLMFYFYF